MYNPIETFMNKAQETLKKIAEALNIASEPTPAPAVEPTVEATPVVEPTPAEAVPQVAVEPVPAVVEPVVEPTPEPVEDTRVADLEKQLTEMKQILADAMREPEPTPEPTPEPVSGLTHSPEAQVAKKANGIGKKGASIQDRVHAYINGSK
tara:strand:+ start:3489 stop:3941 length:453 start_codon:yes stop_codon:yes gene_type:complete